MGSVPVRLNRPPHHARLIAWGRAVNGWFGCCTWSQRVRRSGRVTTIDICAWLPSSALSSPGWSAGANDVPRVDLDQGWPMPPGWSRIFIGAWIAGPLRLPDGLEVVTTPAWRDEVN